LKPPKGLTSEVFVEKSLKQSPLATKASDQPFNGERARACRRALEELVSPERIQELRSQAAWKTTQTE